MDFYRIVCLTLNLIYWIVFSKNNEIQIDENTKEYLFFKLDCNQLFMTKVKEIGNKQLIKCCDHMHQEEDNNKI